MDIEKRKTLKKLIFTGATLPLAACAGLPTNTIRFSGKGKVNVNEEGFSIYPEEILDELYFVRPLNTEKRVLKYGEPSFALIPVLESRVTPTQVGKEGGEVIVDAPKGGLYLPYVYVTDGEQRTWSADFLNVKPVRLITNLKMKPIKKSGKEGKINLVKLTEKDFPFSDETLKTFYGQEYVINEMLDGAMEGVLPMYLTSLPLDPEYNFTEEDDRVRILGDTYVFVRGETIDSYVNKRGYRNPLKESKEPTLKAETDSNQEMR